MKMVKAPKLKRDTIIEWTEEKIDWLNRKFRRVATQILKDYDYADPKKGISVKKYCESVEIVIDLRNTEKISLDDVIEVIKKTNIIEPINECREIFKSVKRDIKKIYKWRDDQINRILTDKELEGLPELESPKILDEYLKGE